MDRPGREPGDVVGHVLGERRHPAVDVVGRFELVVRVEYRIHLGWRLQVEQIATQRREQAAGRAGGGRTAVTETSAACPARPPRRCEDLKRLLAVSELMAEPARAAPPRPGIRAGQAVAGLRYCLTGGLRRAGGLPGGSASGWTHAGGTFRR